ncbi:hypothetical protein EDB81DRAFT_663985, partial [Dactylonectria macrodidyma]
DPTIMTTNKKRFIELKRNGSTERIIIDEVMQRASCIAGRATTRWKAYLKGRPNVPLVVKDSWKYLERDEEGDLLREATAGGVINMARYYHHETVRIHVTDDDIRSNVTLYVKEFHHLVNSIEVALHRPSQLLGYPSLRIPAAKVDNPGILIPVDEDIVRLSISPDDSGIV